MRWIRFDRNELAGSFGDIGTDLPLMLAMIPAAGLDAAQVFVVFGCLQILTGLTYGVPMPMQPLKAMAVIVITQRVSGDVLYAAGLTIGVIMLVLSFSGALIWIARAIPPAVVRGIQLGLGLSLASLALKSYVPSLGTAGYVLAAACFLVIVLLWGNQRIPACLVVIAIGAVYAWGFPAGPMTAASTQPARAFALQVPTWQAIWTGLIVLALPQLPLSLSNSVIATSQTLHDLFPERAIGVRKIGITYGIANILASWVGGLPVCHGCGGLAGHHAFGARSGGSVVIYGSMYLLAGLIFGHAVGDFASEYPRPVLGVILLIEAVALMLLIRDTAGDARRFRIVLLVGAIAFTLPQGFVIGLLVGVGLHYLWREPGASNLPVS